MASPSVELYPPRAGFWRKMWRPVYYAFKREVGWETKDMVPPEIRGSLLLLICFLIPVLPVFRMGLWRSASVFSGGYIFCVTGFLCFIGEPVGTAFLMGALMVHGMGFLLYFREWNQKRLIQEKKPCENVRLKSRLAAGLLVMVMLGIVYWLAFEGLQYRWFFPLRTADGIQVIRAQKSLARLRHGEWVVFKIHQSRFAQVQIHGGLGMDRVLALPGDRVEFHGDVFAVNGNASPALTDMPREGRLIVPPDRCLVWPEQSLRIRNRFVGEQVIGIALMEIALVPESRLIGVPYPTWFGRVQKQ